jgi:hypothetical protein
MRTGLAQGASMFYTTVLALYLEYKAKAENRVRKRVDIQKL